MTEYLDAIENAHIRELTRQRDELLAQNERMAPLIRSFPDQLTAARLDAKEGKPTKYDYDQHAKALML